MKRRTRRRVFGVAVAVLSVGCVLTYQYLSPTDPPPLVVTLEGNDAPLKVFASNDHFLIIPPDGALWYWDPSSPASNMPVRIGSRRDWAKASGALGRGAAIHNDGTLWEWNASNNSAEEFVWSQVSSEIDWDKISSGAGFTVAIRKDGTLWAWGANNVTQLGIGRSEDQALPVQIGTDSNWSTVQCNVNRTFALRTDGTLWAWGEFHTRKNTFLVETPTRFDGNTNWTGLSSPGMPLVQNQLGEWWNPYGLPGETSPRQPGMFLMFPGVPISNPVLVFHDGGPLMVEIQKAGKLQAVPFMWNPRFNGNALGNPQQLGDRSDWVSAWSSGSVLMGLTADNTLWVWDNQLDMIRRSEIGARLERLKDKVTGLIGGGRPAAMFANTNPMHERPRPLMKFVER